MAAVVYAEPGSSVLLFDQDSWTTPHAAAFLDDAYDHHVFYQPLLLLLACDQVSTDVLLHGRMVFGVNLVLDNASSPKATLAGGEQRCRAACRTIPSIGSPLSPSSPHTRPSVLDSVGYDLTEHSRPQYLSSSPSGSAKDTIPMVK